MYSALPSSPLSIALGCTGRLERASPPETTLSLSIERNKKHHTAYTSRTYNTTGRAMPSESLNISPLFSVGFSFDQDKEIELSSPGYPCDSGSLGDALGLNANPGFDYTSVGRQDQTQVLLNMKLQLAKQQEKVESLSSELSHCHGGLGPEDGLRGDSALSTVEPQTKYNEKRAAATWKSSKVQFPMKLYAMLELADVQGYGSSSNAVAWLPHGRAFRVLDEQSFMESIVPFFFKQTKIRSFYRQLNLWGFKRLTMGRDAGAWYNEFFVRGSQSEMRKMVRIKVKGKSKSKSSYPFADHKEPDFYSIATVLPRSSKPTIESPHDDGDGTEGSLSSNEYADEMELSQPKFEGIGASNNMPVQHGCAQSSVPSENELNLSPTAYPEFVTPTLFSSDNVE
ncbi:hypothetical protein ACHAXR_001435, partial [Thalassiosira sp. AJA248-18]